MANDGTRIYIDTNTTPDKGVEIADVQRVLARGANDLGLLCSDQERSGSSLVRANKIKPWAKYKPTRMQGQNPASPYKGTTTQLYGQSTGKYTYGLSIVQYTSLANLKAAASGLGWEYEPPRGITVQSGEYFRILDFNGYYSRATSPFQGVGLPDETYTAGETWPIYLYVVFERPDNSPDNLMLGLSEFVNSTDGILKDWYFGFALYRRTNNTLLGVGTANVAIGQMSDASRCVQCAFPAGTTGTFDLIPFFSYNQISWRGTEPTGTQRYVPIPLTDLTATVVDGGPIAYLSFAFGSGQSISFVASSARFTVTIPTLTATNSSASQTTVNNSIIYFRVHVESASDPTTYWDSTYQSITTGTVPVPGNGSATIFSQTTKQFADTGITAWLQTNGGTWADYRHFVQLYYYYNSTYIPMITFEYPTTP